MLNTPVLVVILLANQLDDSRDDLPAFLEVPPTVSADATEVKWEPIQELKASFSKARFITPDGKTTDPVPFVSVCGIVPCSKQVDAIVKALKVEKSWATKSIEVFGFTIQRQEFPTQREDQDDQRFVSKWKPLSMEPAIEFVSRLKSTASDPIADFHNDNIPAPLKLITNVVTMPLPQRAKGTWGQEATHKSLEKESATILFRFLDTQVEEGKTYRYRVRLEFMNPTHFASRWELGADPFLPLGSTRLSPWSQPSRAVACIDETLSDQ